jgi:ATP-binding cassette, subfamily G (WHITE), eye pigment precursor transporter
MAKSIVKIIKQMALNGKTIVCTIHQPSSEIFALFDQFIYFTVNQIVLFEISLF